MCRGRAESQKRHFDLNKPLVLDDATSYSSDHEFTIRCELCGSMASLYCQADDAFLCSKCDEYVHGANFLAHRHVRCMLCNKCQNLTHRFLVGTSQEMLLRSVTSWPETRSSSHHGEHCGSDNNNESRCRRSLKRPFMFI
ncbi:hypothetical protein QQ045_025463 [Rhodiola kirilowii]